MEKYIDKKGQKNSLGAENSQEKGNDLNNYSNIVSNKEEKVKDILDGYAKTLDGSLYSNNRVSFESDTDVFNYIVYRGYSQLIRICRRYEKPHVPKFELDDLCQEILTIVLKFSKRARNEAGEIIDKSHDTGIIQDVLAMAMTRARGGMLTYNLKNCDTHLSEDTKKLMGKVRKEKGIAKKQDNKEIASKLGATEKDIKESIIHLGGVYSLDYEYEGEEGSYTLAEGLGNTENGFKQVEANILFEDIDKSVLRLYSEKRLNDRDMKVYEVMKNEYLYDTDVSNKSVAVMLDCSSANVSQIRTKIRKVLEVQGGVSLEA